MYLLDQWSVYLEKQRGYSSHTNAGYLSDMQDFLAFLQKCGEVQPKNPQDFEKIDIRTLRSWLASRQSRKYKASSTARAVSAVKNFYGFLAKQHAISKIVLTGIAPANKKRKLPVALSKKDVAGSVEKATELHIKKPAWINLRNRALLVLLYAQGLRISEALKIKKSDLESSHLIVCGKGQKERSIIWLEQAKKIIHQYLKLLPAILKDDDYIFRGEKMGVLTPQVFNRDLARLRALAGLPQHISSHTMRHSFATHLLENGADIRSIQELLGHKNISTTQIYTKVSDKHMEETYKSIFQESDE